MDSLKKLIKTYEKWVATNPETACDLETTTKWVSYFIAGRISDSNVVSELIYSLSNMLVLYNDRIIDRAHNNKSGAELTVSATGEGHNSYCYRLKIMLTTLEYSEVFIEISAKRLFGNKGRWLFVALLQLVKAAGRFFILRCSTEQIITSPALPSLNRRALIKQQKQAAINGTTVAISQESQQHHRSLPENHFTFQLKRSGRIVRKVEGAPPLQYRDFKSLISGVDNAAVDSNIPKALLQAEYLYIAKPLVHLAAMGLFGEKRWKQYTISLALDLISIRQYYRNRHLMSKQQKLEMSRRCINLLLYLMRSPFYERHTQRRLERVLDLLANHVPFAKMIATPLKDYIPHWQSTYFYLWST